MKKITRNEAYRIIYAEARKRGWDSEELHSNLEFWNFNPSSMRQMDAVQLHKVLQCFNLNYFVHDPGSVAQLKVLMTKHSARILPYIKKRFQKDSIFQLTNQQARSTIAVIHNYNKKEA